MVVRIYSNNCCRLIVSIIVYNILVRENNKVREAFATMDVYLKKRWDLIPNIVETVKGYAEHEKETLTSVVDLRNKTYENKVDEEKSNSTRNFLMESKNSWHFPRHIQI